MGLNRHRSNASGRYDIVSSHTDHLSGEDVTTAPPQVLRSKLRRHGVFKLKLFGREGRDQPFSLSIAFLKATIGMSKSACDATEQRGSRF